MSVVVVEEPVREVIETSGPVVVVQNVQREVVEVPAGTVIVERVHREVLTTQTTVVVERVHREVLQVPGTIVLGGTPLQYAPPVDLGDANAEGTQATVARSDHVHRRSLRVRANGQSYARHALRVRGFAVADDAANDQVLVGPNLSGTLAARPATAEPGTLYAATDTGQAYLWV